MTPDHPWWDEFCARLEAYVVRLDDADGPVWGCSGTGNRYVFASAVLWAIGFTMPEIRASFRYFAAHGAQCDCEILWHLDAAAVEPGERR